MGNARNWKRQRMTETTNRRLQKLLQTSQECDAPPEPPQKSADDNIRILIDMQFITKLAINNLIGNLQVSVAERDKIQEATIGQSVNEEWKFQRRNRLTASYCGKIYRLQNSTNNSCALKSILYPKDLSSNPNILRGINLEPKAKQTYEFQNGVEVKTCGLFVSLENGILAASPNGLINEDGILEIKCTTCIPQEIPFRKSPFLKFKNKASKEMELRKNHIYYYQVIQQLYVTERNYCDFFVYYESDNSSDSQVFVERITRNTETDKLWNDRQKKLLTFYEEDMASEIVEP